MTPNPLIQRLRSLTGQHFRYLDCDWCLIEVLAEEDALVLRALGDRHQVQNNQFGQPLRRTPQTLTLPLSDGAAGGYSDEVIALLAGRLTGS